MRTRLATIVTVFALLATACGGGDDESTDAPATSTTTSEAAADPDPDPEPSTDTEGQADESAESTTTTTTSTTTTTTTTLPPTNPLPAVSLADLPDLITTWETGVGDPLELARLFIGFPLEISPPQGATPYEVDLRVRTDDPAQWRWEWLYRAFLPDGAVQEIDADLPEGGPGTIEGRLHYDPLFEALGWRNVGQVISDPSSGGGGPQSVNWAYDTDQVLLAGSVEAEPTSARAWVDEDIGFGANEGTPGHQIEVNALVPAGVLPVPLVDALFAALPPISAPTGFSVRSWDRPRDSFDAELGLRYLTIDIDWVAAEATPGDAGTAFVAALDAAVLQVGVESFFNEGEIEVRDPIGDGVTEWQQDLVFLDRYVGRIEFDANDDGTVAGALEIRLEANRPVLVQPTE